MQIAFYFREPDRTTMKPTTNNVPPDVIEALRQGHQIEAIRLLRTHRTMSLKEAKFCIDQLLQKPLAPNQHPHANASTSTKIDQRSSIPGAPIQPHHSNQGLAPGEQSPRKNNLLWWSLLAGLTAWLLYRYL
jgi:hypothetical protein